MGLALGDALCAPHEGGPLERLVWGVMGRTKDLRRRWTDDTRMSLDLAESFIERRAFDADDVASRFARSYRWSRGYGPGAAKLLKRIRRGADWREANRSVWPEGSLGNGGAMRVPVVALVCHLRGEDCADLARRSAEMSGRDCHPRCTPPMPSSAAGLSARWYAVIRPKPGGSAGLFQNRIIRGGEFCSDGDATTL